MMGITSEVMIEEERMEIDVRMYCESIDLIPEYAKEGDSGFDLRANIPEGEVVTIPPRFSVTLTTVERKQNWFTKLFGLKTKQVSSIAIEKNWELIPSGVKVEIPVGYEIQIRPRSGLAFKNAISVVNTPGTIDSGYRGDVGVILINHGIEPFKVKRGDKIAQGVLVKVEKMNRIPVRSPEHLESSSRGEGGFGHTG